MVKYNCMLIAMFFCNLIGNVEIEWVAGKVIASKGLAPGMQVLLLNPRAP